MSLFKEGLVFFIKYEGANVETQISKMNSIPREKSQEVGLSFHFFSETSPKKSHRIFFFVANLRIFFLKKEKKNKIYIWGGTFFFTFPLRLARKKVPPPGTFPEDPLTFLAKVKSVFWSVLGSKKSFYGFFQSCFWLVQKIFKHWFWPSNTHSLLYSQFRRMMTELVNVDFFV